jgi:hypothetical protein
MVKPVVEALQQQIRRALEDKEFESDAARAIPDPASKNRQVKSR